MADSFADLWSSAAPSTKQQQQPRKLGDHQSAFPANHRRPQNHAFSLLAAPSSTTSTRSNSPSFAGGHISQKSVSKSVKSQSTEDAFSSLLSGSLSYTTNNATMTIAERTAAAEKEKRELLLKQQENMKSQVSAWSGLDSLGSPPVYNHNASVSSHPQDEVDWIFDAPSVAVNPPKFSNPPSTSQMRDEDDDWGLSDFASAPVTSVSNPIPSTNSLLELDGNDRASSPFRRETNSPGDFDFGDRGDRVLDEDSDDEDDVLGSLGRPVNDITRKLSFNNDTVSPNPSGSSRPFSPPPHIIGQIVEMGFSPLQARKALAATDTGLDVQAALENLLADNARGSRISLSPGRQPHRPPPHAHQRNPEYNGDRPYGRHNGAQEPGQTVISTETQKNIQEQADKLLAQASEIGLSVLTRANVLWSQGKEKVQRAYEERKAATVSPQNPAQNGRPKWLQNSSADQDNDNWTDQDGFKDEDEYYTSRNRFREQKQTTSHQIERVSPPRQPSISRARPDDLLIDHTPAVYRSPFRRGPSRPQPHSQPDHSSQPSSSRPRPQRVSSPVQMIRRNAVSATHSAIATSMKHKAVGTDMFKLGRYSEAETAYSAAIVALPDSHLLHVQLYNNRALSRLKTGDYSGAVEDVSAVILLIGASYHPAREAKVTKEEEGSGVDLAEGLMKAYRRRAEAYEGQEKWDLAKKDWEVIAGTEWVAGKTRNDAVAGIGRCRKMSDAGSSPPVHSIPSSKPRKPATTVRRGPIPSAEAVVKLRAANDAADAEEQERHVLKDSVDAKISAWKTGKEDNIRALVASLDTVLWSELGWKKVGMHELVTPAQVKVKYTKAIAKLHPDKLNVNNTTVEQRMVANAAFGALNEAWNAFKQ